MSWLPEHLPGERLAIKIWQTITDGGIGGLLSPWQIRRIGRARSDVRRQEIQTLAQAKRDAADILAGRKTLDETGRLIETRSDEKALPSPASGAVAAPSSQPLPQIEYLDQEQKLLTLDRSVNLRATIAMAEDEAAAVADEAVSDAPVDPDWFARWRTNTEDIHDDEMRRLWARILAGETKQPQSFSLHTLDFMRRLSREDAALIEKVAPFTCGRDLFRADAGEKVMEKTGLSLSVFLELQDLGVISGVAAFGLQKQIWSLRADSFSNPIRFWNKALMVQAADHTKRVNLPAYAVTKVGLQVMSLGKFQANDEYVRAIAKTIAMQGFEVSMGDVQEIENKQYLIVNAHPVSAD